MEQMLTELIFRDLALAAASRRSHGGYDPTGTQPTKSEIQIRETKGEIISRSA